MTSRPRATRTNAMKEYANNDNKLVGVARNGSDVVAFVAFISAALLLGGCQDVTACIVIGAVIAQLCLRSCISHRRYRCGSIPIHVVVHTVSMKRARTHTHTARDPFDTLVCLPVSSNCADEICRRIHLFARIGPYDSVGLYSCARIGISPKYIAVSFCRASCVSGRVFRFIVDKHRGRE